MDRIYRQHWDEICRYVRRRFGSGPPDPEDIVQSAFARLAALETPETIGNPRAFLYRTAHNVAIDAWRRSARGGVALADLTLTDAGTSDDSPEDILVFKDDLARLEVALAGLKTKQRTAFLMHRLDGLSYAEIARRLGGSPSGARLLVETAFEFCMRAMRNGGRGGAF